MSAPEITTPIDEAAELARVATPGPWEHDSERMDEGHLEFFMMAGDGPKSQETRLFDTFNSRDGTILDDRGEGPDGPEGSAWNDTSLANMLFIEAVNPARILAWQAEWAEDKAIIAHLRKIAESHFDGKDNLRMVISLLLLRSNAKAQIDEALDIIGESAGIDGAHHKTWVIDQVVRSLTGGEYEQWVEAYCNGEDGPETYEWDEGVAP